MKHHTLQAMLLALPLLLSGPAMAAPPEDDGAGAGEGGDAADDISEEEALQDDILLVIDLPVAADEAREAGIEEAEIVIALDVADAGAISPGTMAEVLDEETEQVRANGKREAFGQWVKLQVAEGVRGKELAAKIKERKTELAEMSDEDKAALEDKIKEQGEKHRAHRKMVHEKRKKLREEGKSVVLTGEERHAKMIAEAAKRHAEAKAAHMAAKAAHKAEKREDAAEKREDAAEKREDAAEKREDAVEKREDAAEKREDKAEKREDKAEKREDKAEKREDKMDKHEGHGPKDKAPK